MSVQHATQANHAPRKSGCGMISVLALSILSLFLGIAIGGALLAYVAPRNPDVAKMVGFVPEAAPIKTPPMEEKPSVKYGLVYPVEESLRIEGSLTKKEVSNVVIEKRYSLKKCYDTALQKSPTLTGEMFIQFRVGKTSGQALATLIRQSTIDGEEELKKCVIKNINTWKFPGKKERDSSIKVDLLLVPISAS